MLTNAEIKYGKRWRARQREYCFIIIKSRLKITYVVTENLEEQVNVRREKVKINYRDVTGATKMWKKHKSPITN